MTLTVPFFVKVVKIGNSLRATIPKEIADYLRIEEGNTLELTVIDHTISIRKKEV
jgi:AbrB family looped-hinge helix DNA binding protein